MSWTASCLLLLVSAAQKRHSFLLRIITSLFGMSKACCAQREHFVLVCLFVIVVAIKNYLVCVCEEFVYYLVTLGAGFLEFDYHRAMEVFHRDEAYEAARARNHCYHILCSKL